MKSWTKWALAGAIGLALVTGGVRVALNRQAQGEILKNQQKTQIALATIELAATDIEVARMMDLQQGLDISGPIKAVNSAFVKARVAGELQALTVREGDRVKAGQVIARIDASDIQARVRQAQQQAQAARAQADIAKRTYDNNRALVDQGFISKTALESSQATLEAAQATYRAAQAGADVSAKSLQDTVLRAPIDGVVAQRLAQPGERVAIEARIVEIVDLSRLELQATLSAADSLQVRVGQSARISIEGSTTPLVATVERINPSAEAGSRAVVVYLSVPAAPGLRQGLFAQGRLQVGSTHTLALPLNAVRTDKPQPYVQVIQPAGIAHQAVTLGVRGDSTTLPGQTLVAVSGVAEGIEVLGPGLGTVLPGTPVKRALAPTGAP